MTESWSDFGPREAPAQSNSRLNEICARVFTTAAGKELLAELRRQHFETPFSPLAPDRALALRISQQHFVRELELACERGLKANVKPK
ncbi:hypothetical protein IVB03_39490 [Bradyrhizobium sp. 168]|uniref:hypothetical protein n=1 Tax=Bradyrhizobium sp. 168 TaxID=2782639 RepID=UPI001FF71955|nr:hypothetical protein [Bradyrhizobium sp. 168]MCK1585480.1 hypothetical protein [Bradyrhizobium sp. 168]